MELVGPFLQKITNKNRVDSERSFLSEIIINWNCVTLKEFFKVPIAMKQNSSSSNSSFMFCSQIVQSW